MTSYRVTFYDRKGDIVAEISLSARNSEEAEDKAWDMLFSSYTTKVKKIEE